MIYTKPNRFFTPSKSEKPQFKKLARLLGRELTEGIYQGVQDNPSLLHGQYDDETSTAVDPLCQLRGERFERVIQNNPPVVSQQVETSHDVPSDTPSVSTSEASE